MWDLGRYCGKMDSISAMRHKILDEKCKNLHNSEAENASYSLPNCIKRYFRGGQLATQPAKFRL